jgi:DNA-binding response OmpR family regulator
VLTGQRLLIVEDEFLIAIEMQRVLAAAGASETVLIRTLDEAATLGEALAGFDLVILPPPRTDQPQPVLARIAAAGAGIVVCSAFSGPRAGHPLADAEFLDKPFADEELVAACERAMTRRGRVS